MNSHIKMGLYPLFWGWHCLHHWEIETIIDTAVHCIDTHSCLQSPEYCGHNVACNHNTIGVTYRVQGWQMPLQYFFYSKNSLVKNMWNLPKSRGEGCRYITDWFKQILPIFLTWLLNKLKFLTPMVDSASGIWSGLLAATTSVGELELVCMHCWMWYQWSCWYTWKNTLTMHSPMNIKNGRH